MSLWKIAWRSIQQRSLSSLLTGLSMALGVALVVAVLVVLGVVERSFTQNAEGYNIIVGPKGGQLELVLNTVFHLGTPKSTLPWSYYEEFSEGKYAPSVELAIPICLGDNYEGYRVVATTSDLFDKSEYRANTKYTFADGRNFKDAAFFEAVVGSTVARKTGLKVGSTFEPTHGISEDELAHKHDPFKVVGVLDPTGTPNDRALFISVEGFFLLEDHALDEADVETAAPADDAHTHDDLHAHGDESAHDHDHDHDQDQDHDHEHEGEEEADDHDHPHDDEADAENADANDEEHSHEGESADTHDHAHEEEDAHEHAEDDHAEDDRAHDHAHDDHAHDHEHDDHGHDDHAHDDHAHDDHGHSHDHDHSHAHHHEPLPKHLREVTSILLRTNLTGGLSIPGQLQRDPRAMAVMPVREVTLLFEGLVGNLQLLLLGLAILVVVVAGIGIMVSIYNTMNDRRRDIAVMRALGAGRQTVMMVIFIESLLLSFCGGLAGLLLGHALIAVLNPLIVEQTGVSIGLLQFQLVELALIPGLMVLATLAGVVPALAAYRTDVSKALGASP